MIATAPESSRIVQERHAGGVVAEYLGLGVGGFDEEALVANLHAIGDIARVLGGRAKGGENGADCCEIWAGRPVDALDVAQWMGGAHGWSLPRKNVTPCLDTGRESRGLRLNIFERPMSSLTTDVTRCPYSASSNRCLKASRLDARRAGRCINGANGSKPIRPRSRMS